MFAAIVIINRQRDGEVLTKDITKHANTNKGTNEDCIT